MPYKISLTKSAVKELESLPAKTHNKVIEHLHLLEDNPRMHGVEKLTPFPELRLRVGSHRIIFEIDDKSQEVKVLMVEDRRQIYKRLKRKR